MIYHNFFRTGLDDAIKIVVFSVIVRSIGMRVRKLVDTKEVFAFIQQSLTAGTLWNLQGIVVHVASFNTKSKGKGVYTPLTKSTEQHDIGYLSGTCRSCPTPIQLSHYGTAHNPKEGESQGERAAHFDPWAGQCRVSSE